MIKFTVYGEPLAQGRPRFARHGAFVRTYEQEKFTNHKTLVRYAAIEVKPESLLLSPVKCIIRLYKSPPKSFSKKKLELALSEKLRPTTKPDIDNCIKLIYDALNGVIWKDDTQVVESICSKYYSDNPRTEIEIEEI
ncbi:RusA family crossover junction endodeoxyribonuclease [Selenomonadales bacterium OttesenSCG-928-I06]|nr:RusA family crossover junction endodeoxyribonuclease [Selenomonadales bacterium OttesenSCG-928-I06]